MALKESPVIKFFARIEEKNKNKIKTTLLLFDKNDTQAAFVFQFIL